MFFANPWGLLGLLALPAILAIHLFQRRFPPLDVAGLHLWSAEARTQSPGRRREHLPITTTLILELLAALLATAVLARPRIGNFGRAPHLIVVLDNSASMSAVVDGKSFRDAALEQLQRRVDELGRDTVITVMLTGRRPVMLAGPAIPWKEAQPLLQNWRPQATRHSFEPAWDLAAQWAEEAGHLLFLTDHLPDEDAALPERMEVVSVGRPCANVALTAARWDYDSESARGRLFLRVVNWGGRSARIRVRGNSGERTVFQSELVLAGGESRPLESELPGGLGTLEVRLDAPDDALPLDSRAVLVEPRPRLVKIAVTLPKKHPAREPIERVLAAIPDWQPAEPERAHLIIAPAFPLPPSKPGLWWLGVGPLDPSEEARKKSRDLIAPFVIEKRHPLLAGIALGGVVWSGAQPMELSVAPLVSSGHLPLLARLNGTRTTAYVLNLDLGRETANLHRSPDWPILFSNLISLRRDDLPGLRRFNYRLGETIRFRLPEEDNSAPETDAEDELVLVHGEQKRPLVHSALVELPPIEEPGIYEIRHGEESVGRFAVHFFDARESLLTALAPGHREPHLETEPQQLELDSPYGWFLFLLLMLLAAALLADWFVLRPRRISS